MRKIHYLCIFILFSMSTQAQFVSINSNGIAKLRLLIKKDQPGAHLFIQQQQLAIKALDSLPGPVSIISTEGKLKGDPVKTATLLALQDFKKIYALALVYKVYGEPRYLQKAGLYLMAWAKTNIPKGNPINDTNLDPVIEAYDLIKSDLPEAESAPIRNWLKNTAEEEVNSTPKNQNKGTAYNNWNSHRLKIIGEIGFTLGDQNLQQFAVEGLKKQLAVNLLPDGSSIDFKLRDALHYHVYDLEPLLKLCIVINRAQGTDFYRKQSQEGASVQKSVNWLVPFLTGEKQHGEFVHSTVAFDLERAKNGELGYKAGSSFNPLNGLKTLALAAYFDPSLKEVYQKIGGTAYEWQLLLNDLRETK